MVTYMPEGQPSPHVNSKSVKADDVAPEDRER